MVLGGWSVCVWEVDLLGLGWGDDLYVMGGFEFRIVLFIINYINFVHFIKYLYVHRCICTVHVQICTPKSEYL